MLKYVPDHLKTQKMYNRVAEKIIFLTIKLLKNFPKNL